MKHLLDQKQNPERHDRTSGQCFRNGPVLRYSLHFWVDNPPALEEEAKTLRLCPSLWNTDSMQYFLSTIHGKSENTGINTFCGKAKWLSNTIYGREESAPEIRSI